MREALTIIKILTLLLFNYFIFSIENSVLLTSILIIFIIVGMPTHYLFIKRLKTILPVAIMIILFQIIFNTSVPISTRILLGYLAAIRLTTISLSVLLFLTSTSITELVQIFNFLPKKILLLIIMTCYFIPGILYEGEKIKAVQKSRGMHIHHLSIVTNLASLLVPLIHRIFQRAEILSMTILARGYEE
ncbi:MAG TPA: energy-coupling factor transporter transmembrane component T [Candidatus Sulfotelmatobacter sp.]|jgi:energy-coupling factor transporter transmembrane protein EcfT|nr:energy-coupling factor transporter transmembrane component T [Candidatus Sulfotelmatobacter sp.]